MLLELSHSVVYAKSISKCELETRFVEAHLHHCLIQFGKIQATAFGHLFLNGVVKGDPKKWFSKHSHHCSALVIVSIRRRSQGRVSSLVPNLSGRGSSRIV